MIISIEQEITQNKKFFQLVTKKQIIIMLTNTLKRLVYLTRSTKKPPSQSATLQHPTKQSPDVGFSHPISPTLKKIDKRFNEAQQKFQKQQQETMKGFANLKNSMIEQNENRKKTREQQIKEVEEKLKSFEVPDDLRERFRPITKQKPGSSSSQNLSSQKTQKSQQQTFDEQLMQSILAQNISDRQQLIKQIQITGRNIKSEEQALLMKQKIFEEEDPLAQHKLRQEMMINEILKDSKQKQAELNLPKEWKKQLEQKKKKQQQQETLLNEKMRYQKLKQISAQQKGIKLSQASIQSNSELRKLNKLTDKYNIEISPDEIWRQKYPPQLIEKALQYKNKQLHYFKELIEPARRDEWDYKRERAIMRPTKEDQEKRKANNKIIFDHIANKDKQLGNVAEPVQEQGLTRFKDLDYYKEKGLKEFQKQENLQDYDIQLRQAAQKDIDQVHKLSNLYLDDFQDNQQRRLERKEKYQNSSFGKYQIRLKQLSKKMITLGIDHDFQDLALLKKEELFADKKIQEENQSYKQYLIKKEKKKQMKEELRKIHKEKLREDLNFDYEIDPVKLEKLDPVEMEEGLKKMEEIRRLKQSTIVSSDFLKQKIHHTKTLKAMSQFITAYFYNNVQNPNNTISEKVEIGNILANRKNTVLNIFWQFHSNYLKLMEKYKFTEDDMTREKGTLQKILQKQSTYISSKMTEYLGLRYGPEIRFYFNEILEETKQSIEEMKKYKDEIIELTVEEYKEKGLIKTKQQEDEYRRKIEALATNNLQDLNNQKKLISKSFKKKQKFSLKLDERKQKKAKKKQQSTESSQEIEDYKIKRKLSEKQISQITLQKIITEKVEAKKQSIFTPYIEDEDLVFGEKEDITQEMRQSVGVKKVVGVKNKQMRVQKKAKRSPVERLWQEIEKGI